MQFMQSLAEHTTYISIVFMVCTAHQHLNNATDRTKKNYVDPAFVAPRFFDKVFIGLIIMTLYLNIGKQIT